MKHLKQEQFMPVKGTHAQEKSSMRHNATVIRTVPHSPVSVYQGSVAETAGQSDNSKHVILMGTRNYEKELQQPGHCLRCGSSQITSLLSLLQP